MIRTTGAYGLFLSDHGRNIRISLQRQSNTQYPLRSDLFSSMIWLYCQLMPPLPLMRSSWLDFTVLFDQFDLEVDWIMGPTWTSTAISPTHLTAIADKIATSSMGNHQLRQLLELPLPLRWDSIAPVSCKRAKRGEGNGGTR